jgi:hypothetical protein
LLLFRQLCGVSDQDGCCCERGPERSSAAHTSPLLLPRQTKGKKLARRRFFAILRLLLRALDKKFPAFSNIKTCQALRRRPRVLCIALIVLRYRRRMHPRARKMQSASTENDDVCLKCHKIKDKLG